MCVLAIPCTPVPSERMFLTPEDIINAQRAYLSPENVIRACFHDIVKMFQNNAPPSWGSFFFNVAASDPEENASSDKVITDSKLILSTYANLLESSINKRYIEKILVISIDPLLFCCRNILQYAFLSKHVIFCLTSCSKPDSTLRINFKIFEALFPTIIWFLGLLPVFLAKSSKITLLFLPK